MEPDRFIEVIGDERGDPVRVNLAEIGRIEIDGGAFRVINPTLWQIPPGATVRFHYKEHRDG